MSEYQFMVPIGDQRTFRRMRVLRSDGPPIEYESGDVIESADGVLHVWPDDGEPATYQPGEWAGAWILDVTDEDARQ